MKVCYLVLVYNELEYTKKTFFSIKKQSQEKYPFDIICIDNASEKDIALELECFCNENNIIYLRHDFNDGYAGGNNFGWKYAKENNYDYVFIANNDIELLNINITEKIIDEINLDKKITILGTNLQDSNGRNIEYSRFHSFIMKHSKINLSENSRIVCVPTVIGCFFCVNIKKIISDELFNSSFFMYGEEQNLEYQVMLQNGIVAVLNDKNYTVKHFGGFFDYKTSKKWAVYLCIRNTVLLLRNFSFPFCLLYYFIFCCISLKIFLRYKRKEIIKGLFRGVYYVIFHKNDECIQKDAIKSLKVYK